jgi:hypothetical protein
MKKPIKKEEINPKLICLTPEQLTEIQVNCFLEGFKQCIKNPVEYETFVEMVDGGKFRAASALLLSETKWTTV